MLSVEFFPPNLAVERTDIEDAIATRPKIEAPCPILPWHRTLTLLPSRVNVRILIELPIANAFRMLILELARTVERTLKALPKHPNDIIEVLDDILAYARRLIVLPNSS
jgi:hypothetical protein